MAQTDKMLSRKRATELIVDPERVFPVNSFTDDHDRTLAPRPLPRRTEEGVDHNDPVDSLVEVGGAGNEITSTTRSAQCTYQQVLVGRLQYVLQTGGDLADVPRVQMPGDQPDCFRSTRSQA